MEQTHPRQAIQPEQGAPDIAENAPLTANRGQQPEIIGASAASTKPGESQELQQGHPHRDHRDVLNPFDFGVDPASLK